eukprot:TRINITY_DN44918_c0_g1_i1.p1 TRINITY_DN44918_c0_g1~~TRINITY_DN44918_c0_g1_i1.p1  ORF type:complete len:592 (+),score=123.64 TRINITY_DN44918_c0_g1_i1:55-1830(+)
MPSQSRAARRATSAGANVGSKATWHDVVDALAALEIRQESFKAELASVRALNRAAQERRDQEVIGLKCAHATAAVQFRRQSHALATHASHAGRQATRAKSLALRAAAAVQHSRTEAENARAALQGANSALAARDQEVERLRAQVGKLQRQVLEQQKDLKSRHTLVNAQEDLLDEAALVIQDSRDRLAAASKAAEIRRLAEDAASGLTMQRSARGAPVAGRKSSLPCSVHQKAALSASHTAENSIVSLSISPRQNDDSTVITLSGPCFAATSAAPAPPPVVGNTMLEQTRPSRASLPDLADVPGSMASSEPPPAVKGPALRGSAAQASAPQDAPADTKAAPADSAPSVQAPPKCRGLVPESPLASTAVATIAAGANCAAPGKTASASYATAAIGPAHAAPSILAAPVGQLVQATPVAAQAVGGATGMSKAETSSVQATATMSPASSTAASAKVGAQCLTSSNSACAADASSTIGPSQAAPSIPAAQGGQTVQATPVAAPAVGGASGTSEVDPSSTQAHTATSKSLTQPASTAAAANIAARPKSSAPVNSAGAARALQWLNNRTAPTASATEAPGGQAGMPGTYLPAPPPPPS